MPLLFMESYQNYFFLYFFEAINLVLRRKIVQNLLIFAYLFFPKSSTIDSRKSSITLEWLAVESCPTPRWIGFLMLALSIGVHNYLVQNRLIEILRKSVLKVLIKYTLRIEVGLWKVLRSQHFQFKRFQDEKMESPHFPTQTYKK